MARSYLQAQDRRYVGLDEREWTGSFFFTQMADTQLGLLNANEAPCTWEAELAMLQLSVDHINAICPRFVVICGDLTNAMPNGPTAAPVLLESQVAALKDALNHIHLDIPLVCLCGNHDVGDLPNRATIQAYSGRFGDDYFSFWVGGCHCIVINSSLYAAMDDQLWDRFPDDLLFKDDTLQLAYEQNTWLEQELRSHPAVHTMMFSHIPPYICASDEPRGYFNLPPHVRDPLIKMAQTAGVSKWFCGHFHRNASAWAESLEVVVTSAVGTFIPYAEAAAQGRNVSVAIGLQGMDWDGRVCSPATSGLRHVCVTKETIGHKWFTLQCLPANVDPEKDTMAWAAANSSPT